MKDQDIYEGIRDGKASTVDFLYRKYAPSLLGYILKNNGSEHDSYELFYTTILSIWENIQKGSYQLSSTPFEAYFFTIATNRWIDELRRRKRHRTETIDTYDLTAKDDTQADLRLKLAADRRMTAISAVLADWQDSVCKTLIEAFHLQDVSLLDLSKRFGFDYNAVRKRIFDCRKKLAKLATERLGSHTDEEELFSFP